jgi:hypothetical protein
MDAETEKASCDLANEHLVFACGKRAGEFMKFNSCFTCIYFMLACSRVVNMDLVNDNLERIFTYLFIIFIYSSSSG